MAQDALVTLLPSVPVIAPGAGMTELVKHLSLVSKSRPIASTDTTTVNVFEFNGNELVLGVQVNVTTAFDASGSSAAATGTISVPGATGAVVLWDAANVGLQTLTTDFMVSSTNTGPVQIPASGGFLKFNYTPSTTGAGALEIYLRYVPDVTKL